MDRALIISGENKGKSGDVIGMFYGAGICVIKTDDEKEYVAKLSEIKILYPIEKRTVIGLPKEMVDEIAKNCSIAFHRDKGEVWFYDCNEYRDYEPIECEESFIEALKRDYGIEVPRDYILFAPEGRQNFDFYIGIMF